MPNANPLPDCSSKPDCCNRVTRHYPGTTPSALFTCAQEALGYLSPIELRADAEAHRLEAVFRVAFVFKDDVAIAITAGSSGSDGGGTALHIRSASRVGKSDLGVNKRRIERFFRALGKQLPDARSGYAQR